jgi:hypothetical protein
MLACSVLLLAITLNLWRERIFPFGLRSYFACSV